MTHRPPLPRRRLLGAVAVAATASAALPARATNDGPPHKIVYQLNKSEPDYQEAILNSVGAMLKKYVDDVAIAVVVWGPGIHLLAKKPQRPVAAVLQQRVKSMSESYEVEFVACGNTMHSLNWTQANMLEVARIEEVGAAALMEYQEKGYAYVAW